MTEQQHFSESGQTYTSWKLKKKKKKKVKKYSLGRKKDKVSLEFFEKLEYNKMKTSRVISKRKNKTKQKKKQ